jgi:hypothetical protein
MLAEFARVLAPTGIVVISSPNRRLYSDERNYVNEFHAHELYRDGLAHLLAGAFPAQRWYHQRIATWSGIWSEGEGTEAAAEAWVGAAEGVARYVAGEGMYFVVVAARSRDALPPPVLRVSLLSDAGDSEGRRAAANAGEVLRLDALLKTATAGLDRQAAHILHLEALVAERARMFAVVTQKLAAEKHPYADAVAERERMVAALQAEIARLHGAVKDLERTVSYRQSFRWWLALPWMRLRLWLGRRGS